MAIRRPVPAQEPPAQRAAKEETADRLEHMARITLRPMASPLALGFGGLVIATFVVSGLNLGWMPVTDAKDVGLLLLAFVFPLQLLTSILGYLQRDGIAGTGMGVLAGTWLGVGLVFLTSKPGSTSDALGLFLLASGTLMLIPAIGAFATKVVPGLVLTGAAIRFLSTGIYQLTAMKRWETTAGVVGLVLAALALYAAFAAGLEDSMKRTVLPLGRRSRGRQAVDGTLLDQLQNVRKEPGVRQQL
jgi:succinate-acetate transporter protein